MEQLFKSVIDQDRQAVVLCDLNHQIIYMNPAAIQNYTKRGGEKLLGQNLLDCHNEKSQAIIKKVVAWFEEDIAHNMIYTYHNPKKNKDVYMVALRDEQKKLIGYYEKHEFREKETSQTYDFTHSLV